MNEQQERSAFEAWVKETRGSPWPIALDRADAGNYMYLPAIEAWAVWQARSKLAANVPADHATLLNIRVALVKGTKWCLPTAAAELRQALKDLDAMLAAAPAPEADADALRLADAIDPFTRKAAPDHLTSKVAADALRRLAFATVPAQAQQPSEPMTNIESPFNACQHREHCKGWKMVATDVVGRAKPEAQQPEYRLLVKGDVFKDGDECLLDDCKRWAPITPIFRGHPHMPGFHVPHRRPEAGIGASGEAL